MIENDFEQWLSEQEKTKNTTWRTLITSKLTSNNETWDDVISCVVNANTDAMLFDEKYAKKVLEFEGDLLDFPFYPGYGITRGPYFTIWTEKYVYFPHDYDGLETVASVPRNPNDIAMEHIK